MARSWLFTRNDESVLLSLAGKHAVTMDGPGHRRQQLEFDNDAAVEAYQREIALDMAAGGWILYGVDRQRRSRERAGERLINRERRLRN